jgi:predicted metalloenzyme YecM
MYISPYLRFHLQQIDKPKEAWEHIESVSGKHNITRAQQLENQVLTLIPFFFLALKTIYLTLKHSKFYVKNVR